MTPVSHCNCGSPPGLSHLGERSTERIPIVYHGKHWRRQQIGEGETECVQIKSSDFNKMHREMDLTGEKMAVSPTLPWWSLKGLKGVVELKALQFNTESPAFTQVHRMSTSTTQHCLSCSVSIFLSPAPKPHYAAEHQWSEIRWPSKHCPSHTQASKGKAFSQISWIVSQTKDMKRAQVCTLQWSTCCFRAPVHHCLLISKLHFLHPVHTLL